MELAVKLLLKMEKVRQQKKQVPNPVLNYFLPI